MPQSTHDRAAELHNLAAHAHAAAATAHGKGDHLTAHELSQQAHEHSMNAHKLAEELGTKIASASKAKGGMPEVRADLNRLTEIEGVKRMRPRLATAGGHFNLSWANDRI